LPLAAGSEANSAIPESEERRQRTRYCVLTLRRSMINSAVVGALHSAEQSNGGTMLAGQATPSDRVPGHVAPRVRVELCQLAIRAS
jgi:hypothetical protein